MGGAKSMYTISRCRKHLKPWSLPAFKTDALRLYMEVCAAQAAGDRTALKQVCGRSWLCSLCRALVASHQPFKASKVLSAESGFVICMSVYDQCCMPLACQEHRLYKSSSE